MVICSSKFHFVFLERTLTGLNGTATLREICWPYRIGFPRSTRCLKEDVDSTVTREADAVWRNTETCRVPKIMWGSFDPGSTELLLYLSRTPGRGIDWSLLDGSYDQNSLKACEAGKRGTVNHLMFTVQLLHMFGRSSVSRGNLWNRDHTSPVIC